MVGRLNLQHAPEDDPLDMKRKAERVLDSPDSGLPPSPSPSSWMLAGVSGEKGVCSGATGAESGELAAGPMSPSSIPHLYPLSYGEGIELNPLPPKEIRYTSSVRYDSDRHFIHDVSLRPVGLAVESCSQTVVVLSGCTWRRYKTRLDFQPRQRPQRYQSTTIVYPKHARAVYTTRLDYDSHRLARRFLSSVELEAGDSALGQRTALEG
ncbi:refilin-B [Amia ocellicauda]|uniref:refilin-B n=1 Tax=Amia ocellicauda TaxID=2972642 RepID=UPI003463D036